MNSKTLLYILKRIALAVLTVWVVITVTFFVMRAVPGGPFLAEKAVSEAATEALMAKYGMDVIDSGVALLSMHAPYEVSSKADVYEAYKGYRAFLKNV